LLELAVSGLTTPFGLARVDCRRQVDIRPEVLNVDGEVDVLREAVNQPMGLGERGAALEGEALQELLICVPRICRAQTTQMSFSSRKAGQPDSAAATARASI